jgi:hypothetical protein
MQIFDRFEKNFLFGLTRIFAMLIIFGILIAVGIGSVLFAGVYSEKNTKVSTAEIIDLIKPHVTTNLQSGDGNLPVQPVENINLLPSVKMPFILQKHFNTPDHMQILKDWLDELPKDNHQEFIDEMAIMVTEAEKLNISPLTAIHNYKELKFKIPSVKIPFILQKHFDNPVELQELKGWLDELPKDNHQEFIDEMAIMVTEAEKLDLSPYTVINDYKKLKFKKLAVAPLEKAEQLIKQLYYTGAIISAVALIALFSLILVLLAIERNTRRVE